VNSSRRREVDVAPQLLGQHAEPKGRRMPPPPSDRGFDQAPQVVPKRSWMA
jgi:hypothetical protein